VGARGYGGARGSACGGASSYDGAHCALTRGGDGSLKGGDGYNQGSRSDVDDG
jgi:hypothetical protein